MSKDDDSGDEPSEDAENGGKEVDHGGEERNGSRNEKKLRVGHKEVAQNAEVLVILCKG